MLYQLTFSLGLHLAFVFIIDQQPLFKQIYLSFNCETSNFIYVN